MTDGAIVRWADSAAEVVDGTIVRLADSAEVVDGAIVRWADSAEVVDGAKVRWADSAEVVDGRWSVGILSFSSFGEVCVCVRARAHAVGAH